MGFFLLIPVMNYQLLLRPGMDAAYIAFLGNLRYICQDLSMIPCACMLKRVSGKRALSCAAVIRGFGFMLFAAQSRTGLILAAVLTGVGGGLFFPAAMELYRSMTQAEERGLVFARREMLNSLGAVIGPVICSLLRRFELVCLGAGLLYMSCAVVSWLGLPETAPTAQKPRAHRKRSWHGIIIFMACCAVASVWQNQQMAAMAIYAHRLDYAGVEWITLVVYAFMTLAQVPLSCWAAEKLGTPCTLALSVLLFMTGLLVQQYASGIWGLYAGNLVFALGILLFGPAKSSAFSALHGRVEVSMLVGVHGLLTSIGSASVGALFGELYNSDAGWTMAALAAGGAVTAGILGYASPQEIRNKTEG